MSHTLEADGIQLEFHGRKILSDIYIKCETGKIAGLLGRNGQGKTCLMQSIYGSLELDIKSVRFDGKYVARPYMRSDLLAYMPQFNFIPAALRIARVFEDFGLEFSDFVNTFPTGDIYRDAKINSLSGGQRRLLELYVIIKSKSQFTMLDEPFSHNSPVQIDQVKELLLEEKKNKGFLITDHMFRHIQDISDSIYLLANGKVHLTTSADDFEHLGYVRF